MRRAIISGFLAAGLLVLVVPLRPARACGIRLPATTRVRYHGARKLVTTSMHAPIDHGASHEIVNHGGTRLVLHHGGAETPTAATRVATAPAVGHVDGGVAVEPSHAEPVASGREVDELFFGRGATALSAAQRQRLDDEASWLAAHPDKRITIEGHANATGSAAANQRLSEARAQAARDYLVGLGVADARITVVGLGSTQPAYRPARAAHNRRIHIVSE